MVAAVKTAVEVKVPAAVEVPQGMTAAWFDQAVQRSFEKDITVKGDGSGRYLMTSSRDSKLVYTVTADSCQCEGHQRFGRCYHCARAAFEDSFSGPEPSAPGTVPAPRYPQVDYAIAHQLDGTFDVVEFFIRKLGDVTRSNIGTYGTEEAARAAIARAKARRQRGPVHAVDCPVCDGWGCDRSGIACQHCHGKGEMMQPVPSVGELLRRGEWPGQPSKIAA